jgi:hypothetical protein
MSATKRKNNFTAIQFCQILSQLRVLHLINNFPENPCLHQQLTHKAGGVSNCRTLLVDGEMFSWYGSRMLMAADYLANLRSHC